MSEEKQQTATQLFASYMRTVERVRGLSKKLTKETETALKLSQELAERFGIHVSGNKPHAPRAPETMALPSEDAEGYKPPAQYHSDAPKLSSRGSQEVADIRRESGLDVEAEDSAALAAAGMGMMEQLQRGMKGKPTVVAQPGEHHQTRPTEQSNAEGGPVTQRPIEEGQ